MITKGAMNIYLLCLVLLKFGIRMFIDLTKLIFKILNEINKYINRYTQSNNSITLKIILAMFKIFIIFKIVSRLFKYYLINKYYKVILKN